MSGYLLAISIGPVQDFIAAARRTRDLWFGSYLLSEISKATAKSVSVGGGNLIFPAPVNSQDLNEDSLLNVANVILAELPETLLPQLVVRQARGAACARWEKEALKAMKEANKFIDPSICQDQISDVVEFYAAWVSVKPEQYDKARRDVMRLLAGRKACRNFIPSKGRAGLPKSSLDGLRETVLLPVNQITQKDRNALRLSIGEQLDLIGLTKRFGGGKKSYPSISRIAADPWIRKAAKNEKTQKTWEDLNLLCEELANGAGLSRIDKQQFPQFELFPYEGSILYRNRHPDLVDELDISNSQKDRLVQDIKFLEEVLQTPDPYFAILAADGDRMGKTISEIKTQDSHREFSQNLSAFARDAKNIIDKYKGSLVYSGGDDVLAFLPLDQCLSCARELHYKFCDLLKGYRDNQGKSPTLSVGICIGHFLEPMQDLLGFAREAEKKAKGNDRDGFAIHLHTRGGAPLYLCDSWASGIDQRLKKWAGYHVEGLIPDKAAYDLRELARRYESWTDTKHKEKAIGLDARLLLSRKEKDIVKPGLDELLNRLHDSCSILKTAEEIIVARRLEGCADTVAPPTVEEDPV